ncbi:MAG: hypothetical protein EPO01_18870 [Aquabacterium sp.]|nr:MAG: hypothetical protein EPO12_15645 [Aquabacterium sp.]TAL15074.1 MAG: hypothetical protein EPO01_18870 [Aquabacterium sp.]
MEKQIDLSQSRKHHKHRKHRTSNVKARLAIDSQRHPFGAAAQLCVRAMHGRGTWSCTPRLPSAIGRLALDAREDPPHPGEGSA